MRLRIMLLALSALLFLVGLPESGEARCRAGHSLPHQVLLFSPLASLKNVHIVPRYARIFCIARNKNSGNLYDIVRPARHQDTVKRGQLELSVGSGYQQEDFRWSIAGNLQGRNPNILSELIWKDLRGPLISAWFRWKPLDRFYLQGSFSRFFILDGQVTDTDYDGDNRTDPSFYDLLDSDQGGSTFASAGVGYDLRRNEHYYLIPYLGYRMDWQTLFLLDREQAGREEELQGTYKTRWNGPYISLEPGVFLTERLTASAVFTYALMRYHARASWHLIEDFQQPVSFRQWTNGQGLDAQVRLSLQLRPSFLSVYLSGNYFYWDMAAGTDELYLTTGETPRTRLNDVVRKGFGIRIGARISL